MIEKWNRFMAKWLPIFTPLSVAAGVVLAPYLHVLSNVVPWLFAFMTFAGSLTTRFRTFQTTITHPLPVFLALFILHVAAPLWALGVGHIVYDDPLTITGLVLALVIPTGITSLIWVSMHKGNVSLTLCIILLDTLLSPILVPLSMSLLVGASVEMQVWDLMKGLLIMIVLPFVAAMVVNQVTGTEKAEQLNRQLAPFSKTTLPVIIAINSSVVAPYLKEVNRELFVLLAVVFFVVLSGYFFSWVLALLFKQRKENVVALLYTGGMRNISAGAVVAVSFFPPKAAVPVVMCMLFQQLLAAGHGAFLKRVYDAQILFKKSTRSVD